MRKKSLVFLSLLLTVILSFSVCFAQAAAQNTYTAGTYTSTVKGHNGDLTLSVTFSENAITEITVGEHKETAGIADTPIERIPAAIIKDQTLAVDTVSGATVTSLALLAAVEDCVTQAGGNVEALKTKAETEKIDEAKKETVKKETEVIIVGAGGAGLAAAVRLGEMDVDCIIVEKMPSIGGNTVRSGAAYNAVDPDLQKAQGIEDSVELHIEQTYEGGDKVGNLDLIKVFCENALDSIEWLEKYGTVWQDNITAVIGATWPRTHYPENSIGSDFTVPLEKAINDFGQEMMLDTQATEIILEDGRAVGIIAHNTQDNTPYEIRATKGVIVATGGFAANVERCRSYNDKIPADIKTSNHPGATGDGLDMAVAAGAALEGIEYIQMLPIGSAPTVSTVIDSVIFVNSEGNRFVQEDGRRDIISYAILDQPEQYMYMINDQEVVDAGVSQHGIEERLAAGSIYKADTLEELAEQIGVPAENLTAAVEAFNKHVDSKEKDEFGREVYASKIDVGPFWASAQQRPVLHHTMGGVRIDTDARVLNDESTPIPGLYAAGEVAGGIHGSNRLGGNALPDVFVFGRIAAESAVEGK